MTDKYIQFAERSSPGPDPVSNSLRRLVVLSATGSAVGVAMGVALMILGSTLLNAILVWGFFGTIATGFGVLLAMRGSMRWTT